MRATRHHLRHTIWAAICLTVLAASCGGTTTTTATPAAGGGGGTSAVTAPAGEYDALVAAAKKEGKVTIYSSQGLDQLNALAEAFKAKYEGIEVVVVRGVDGDLLPRIDTEISTGKGNGDLLVTAASAAVEKYAAAGDFLKPASPELTGKGAYDAKQYVHSGNQFEVGAAVLTFGWNTELYEKGLKDYPDVIDPSLKGKIGIVDPAGSGAIVDFYYYLEEHYGEKFLQDLAALEPRIYPSSLPMGEALQSGEISAGLFLAPVQLVPAKDKGAPVEFGIAKDGAWGARYYGGVMKSAPNPNAAQLLADFMVTAQGQELVQGASGSVLPNIPGTLITVDKVRVPDPAGQTPEKLAAYRTKWDALFR